MLALITYEDPSFDRHHEANKENVKECALITYQMPGYIIDEDDYYVWVGQELDQKYSTYRGVTILPRGCIRSILSLATDFPNRYQYKADASS